MSSQVCDSIEYLGIEYDIASCSNRAALFEPGRHGLRPVSKWHHCWRGYQCCYRVVGDRLLLETLRICCEEPLGTLLGVAPERDALFADGIYHGLAHAIQFTGCMLIGKKCDGSFDLLPGRPPPWAYHEALELFFRNGELVNATDRTEDMRYIRSQSLNTQGIQALRKWLQDNFDCSYWNDLYRWLPELPEEYEHKDFPPLPPGLSAV